MENEGSTKECPYCGETIKAVAVKCRYCNEWFVDKKEFDHYRNIKEQMKSAKKIDLGIFGLFDRD